MQMLYFHLFIFPIAIAQLSGFPPCAESCYSLVSSPVVSACVALWSTNYDAAATCACQDTAFIQAVADCGASVCPPDTVEEVYGALASICQKENVTIAHTITVSSSTVDTTIVLQTSTTSTASAATTSSALSMKSTTQSRTSSSSGIAAETSKSSSTGSVVRAARVPRWIVNIHVVVVGLLAVFS